LADFHIILNKRESYYRHLLNVYCVDDGVIFYTAAQTVYNPSFIENEKCRNYKETGLDYIALRLVQAECEPLRSGGHRVCLIWDREE
jgi:hypothetical protein